MKTHKGYCEECGKYRFRRFFHTPYKTSIVRKYTVSARQVGMNFPLKWEKELCGACAEKA